MVVGRLREQLIAIDWGVVGRDVERPMHTPPRRLLRRSPALTTSIGGAPDAGLSAADFTVAATARVARCREIGHGAIERDVLGLLAELVERRMLVAA
ncbi:MAG: hypothetical protein WCP98_19965 [Actinomycetes bacterium]